MTQLFLRAEPTYLEDKSRDFVLQELYLRNLLFLYLMTAQVLLILQQMPKLKRPLGKTFQRLQKSSLLREFPQFRMPIV